VQFGVVFDYTLTDVLARLVTKETVVATCSPNSSVEELSVGWHSGDSHFPVGPRDERRQSDVLDGLITDPVATGADVVVLPELVVTEQMACEMEDWVRRPDGLRVLVAGSYHHADGHATGAGLTRRRNTEVTWVRGHPAPLLHKHAPGDRPVLEEDIQPDGWPELRVLVTRDGWHIVIAICRDLQDPAAVHALSEAGANLILVPAMSETLLNFGAPTAQLVGANQALVAIANNPARWPGGSQGDRWGSRAGAHTARRWCACHPETCGDPGRAVRRTGGPAALVSERAADLSNYARQWVFPADRWMPTTAT